MKDLILITNEYPYGKGEYFLENEIKYLSESFRFVYIFSILGRTSEIPTRKVFNNVFIFPLNDCNSKSKYLLNVCRGIFYYSNMLSVVDSSIKKFIARLYLKGRSIYISNRIMNILNNDNIVFDEVVIYSFWFSYQALSAFLLGEKLKKKGINCRVISRAHGYDLYWERNSLGYLPFQDTILQGINMVYPCSEFGKKYLLKKYSWAEEKITVSLLGTNYQGKNIYDKTKTFVTCCNMEPIKRMTLFANSFVEVSKKYDVNWICIGDGEELENVKKIISENGLQEKVDFLGRITNKDVLSLYSSRSIMYFCNVSITEGLPVSIMEAMSFGIPVIATDVGGVSELVSDKNGILINSSITSASLCKILKKMICINENEYKLLREQSFEIWNQKVNADVNYKKFIADIMSL